MFVVIKSYLASSLQKLVYFQTFDLIFIIQLTFLTKVLPLHRTHF